MDYQIKRSKRKTMALMVLPDGTVEVRAPLKTPSAVIHRFVISKQEWITQKQTNFMQRLAQRNQLLSSPVKQVRLLGQLWPVNDHNINQKITFDGQSFGLPSGTLEELQTKIIAFYKHFAKKYLFLRVQALSSLTALTPTSVRITSATGSWGSCSYKNSLSFSWRLILASPQTIDYVIIHELCHISEHNHSQAFWDLVSNFVPNWKSERKKLNELADILRQEGW